MINHPTVRQQKEDYRKILLINSFVTMATYWVPDLPILKHFCPPLAFHFHVCKWCLVCIIQQAYKYVRSTSWPRLAFFDLKNTNILKSSGWGLGKSELPWEWNLMVFFYSNRCVCCRTISLPSLSVLHCKLAKIAPFICLI